MPNSGSFIASLFPGVVRTYLVNPALIKGALHPDEEALIEHVVPKRRSEFTAGRLCARRALEQLSISNYPLLMGKDREPLWPDGIVGSISHTEDYCGVAVAKKKEIRSVGLDIECIKRMEGFDWALVCTPEELSWIDSFDGLERKEGAALIFSAKECFYKFQYGINRQWLGFHDVAVSADGMIGEFEVKVLVDKCRFIDRGALFRGKYLIRDGCMFTGMSLEARNG